MRVFITFPWFPSPCKKVMFRKCFEKAVKARLFKYLTRYNVLLNCQFGFREELLDDSQHLCISLYSLGVRCTWTLSAVDGLGEGIRGTVFEDYLSERKQVVCISKYLSRSTKINYGALLGVIIFPLYIHDLKTTGNIINIVPVSDGLSWLWSYGVRWYMSRRVIQDNLSLTCYSRQWSKSICDQLSSFFKWKHFPRVNVSPCRCRREFQWFRDFDDAQNSLSNDKPQEEFKKTRSFSL